MGYDVDSICKGTEVFGSVVYSGNFKHIWNTGNYQRVVGGEVGELHWEMEVVRAKEDPTGFLQGRN